MCQEENTRVRRDCARGQGHPGLRAVPPLTRTGMEQITPSHHSTELLTRIKRST